MSRKKIMRTRAKVDEIEGLALATSKDPGGGGSLGHNGSASILPCDADKSLAFSGLRLPSWKISMITRFTPLMGRSWGAQSQLFVTSANITANLQRSRRHFANSHSAQPRDNDCPLRQRSVKHSKTHTIHSFIRFSKHLK